jgi:AcrR family transcriptional regulator
LGFLIPPRYRHFADKEALLAAVAEEGFLEFTHYLKTAVAEAPQDPLKQLQVSGVAYVRYALDHPTHYRVMFGKYGIDSPDYQSLIEVSNQSFAILVNIILDGQSAGVMREGDPKQLALGAWALVHGLAMLFLENRLMIENRHDAEILTAQTIQLIETGIASR